MNLYGQSNDISYPKDIPKQVIKFRRYFSLSGGRFRPSNLFLKQRGTLILEIRPQIRNINNLSFAGGIFSVRPTINFHIPGTGCACRSARVICGGFPGPDCEKNRARKPTDVWTKHHNRILKSGGSAVSPGLRMHGRRKLFFSCENCASKAGKCWPGLEPFLWGMVDVVLYFLLGRIGDDAKIIVGY